MSEIQIGGINTDTTATSRPKAKSKETAQGANTRQSKHKRTITEFILKNGHCTAADFNISNANEYLCQMEQNGEIYRVWSKDKKCKLAYLTVARKAQIRKYGVIATTKKQLQEEFKILENSYFQQYETYNRKEQKSD